MRGGAAWQNPARFAFVGPGLCYAQFRDFFERDKRAAAFAAGSA